MTPCPERCRVRPAWSGPRAACGGGDPFAVVRDRDSARTVGLPGNPLAGHEEDEVYTCTHEKDCFDQCPEPRFDDGTTWCRCKQLGNLTYECRVRDLGPGEDIPDDGGLGGGGTDYWKCGDLRDTLAAEYVRKHVPQAPLGSWKCRVFAKHPRFIVLGQGIENGLKHDTWGYVNPYMSGGMAMVEAHFRTFHITSGYRCPVGNASIPRAAVNSAHMRGRAADFLPLPIDSTWTWDYKGKLIDWALTNTWANEGFRYTSKNHVHLGFEVQK